MESLKLVQAKLARPYLKQNTNKRAGGMAEMVKSLPAVYKTLSSNASNTHNLTCVAPK
jgi:hypothetical protein